MNAASPIKNIDTTVALNADWLKQNLPAYLWREDETPQALAEVAVVQTWPSKKRTTILYRLAWQNSSPARHERLYVGYLSSADRLADEYKAIVKKIRVQPVEGRPAFMVPEANLVLLAFPNDRKMRLLTEEELFDGMKTQLRHARKTAKKRWKKWKLQSARLEVLRYVPDKRFTMRCRVWLKKKKGGDRSFSFIAKQLTDYRKARRLFNTLAALEKSWPVHADGVAPAQPPVRFPRPLAWHQEKAMILLEDLPGKSLEQSLAEVNLPKTLHAVGEMLAAFHAAQKRVPKKISLLTELKENRAAVRDIVAAAPASRPRLRQLLLDLKNLAWEEREPPVLLHGTFRLNHIFVHEDKLALLDLDSMRMGPPAYDLANFFSSLYYFAAEGRVTIEQRREIMRHFLAGYAGKSSRVLAPAAVLWFSASLLINKQAEKYATHFHPDRAEKIGVMLALAESLLAQARHLPEEIVLANLGQVLP